MNKAFLNMVLAAAMIGGPTLVGCDRTVEEKQSVKTSSDGTTVTDSKKVTQSSDGTVKETREHTVDK